MNLYHLGLSETGGRIIDRFEHRVSGQTIINEVPGGNDFGLHLIEKYSYAPQGCHMSDMTAFGATNLQIVERCTFNAHK